MRVEQAYIIGQHGFSFKPGEKALIVGVKIVTPIGKKARVCYEALFDDGTIDCIPVSDFENDNYIICKKVDKK